MPFYPNQFIPYPFSGIGSGYIIHPYHVSRLYDDLSGVQNILGFNPLNGYASVTARLTGVESAASAAQTTANTAATNNGLTSGALTGFLNLNTSSVRAPLVLVNAGPNSILSGKFAGATESGFLSQSDWNTFNNKAGSFTVGGPLYFNGSLLTGSFAGALESGFLSAVDWTSFNSRVFRAGDTMTGGLTVLGQLSGTRLWDSGTRPVGFIVNLGTINSLVGTKSDNIYNIKGILAGSGNIGIASNANDIIISITGSPGGVDTGTFGNFTYAYNETPAGAINSSNVTYTLSQTPSPTNSLSLTKNGLTLYSTNDFSLSGPTITMVSPPISGSVIKASYSYASLTGIGLYTVGVTTPLSTTLNSMTTWGNTTGTQLLSNQGITTDGNSSLTIGGNLSGITSGTQNIGTSGVPFANVNSNQYSTTRFLQAPGGAATTISFNWNTGSSQYVNFNPGLSGNVYASLSNPLPGSTYLIQTLQNPSGTTNLYFPSTVKWQGRVSGVMTASGNSIDLFKLYWDGTSYYGNVSQNFG